MTVESLVDAVHVNTTEPLCILPLRFVGASGVDGLVQDCDTAVLSPALFSALTSKLNDVDGFDGVVSE